MEGEEKNKNTDTSTKTDKLEDKEFEGRNRCLIISESLENSQKYQ